MPGIDTIDGGRGGLGSESVDNSGTLSNVPADQSGHIYNGSGGASLNNSFMIPNNPSSIGGEMYGPPGTP